MSQALLSNVLKFFGADYKRILLNDDSLLRILRFPGYFETRYFELFSISLGTSK